MKIAITPSSFAASNPIPMEELKKTNLEIFDNPYKRRLTEEEAFQFLEDKDGLIAGLEPLTRKVLENAKNLKVISRVGIGMDNIDHAAAKELGIKVLNTPDGPTTAVAEMTVSALLSLLKNIVPLNEAVHNGKWKKVIGGNIEGKKILLIGFGRIGQKTGKALNALGAEIAVFDPYAKNLEVKTFETLEEGLGWAEVISFHASGRETLIDEKLLEKIQPGTILLNSARAELIPENLVIKGLEEGIFFGVWFDAFWEEPYTGPLQGRENVLLTPHSATYTKECRLGMELQAVKNLLKEL